MFCFLVFWSDTKQNKGSILKASVDYILYAQNQMKEVDKLKELNKRLVQKLKVIKMGKKRRRKIQKMDEKIFKIKKN